LIWLINPPQLRLEGVASVIRSSGERARIFDQ